MINGDTVNVIFSTSDERPFCVRMVEGTCEVTLLLPDDCGVGEVLHPFAFPLADGLQDVIAFGHRYRQAATGWQRIK